MAHRHFVIDNLSKGVQVLHLGRVEACKDPTVSGLAKQAIENIEKVVATGTTGRPDLP
jgi:hypothetical protein